MFSGQGSFGLSGSTVGVGEMAKEVIQKLFESFQELEHSLEVAKDTLAKREPRPEELLARIDNYEQILQKQRKLANRLCEYISAGDWNEVSRHIRLINGLTSLIYGDASELSLSSAPEKRVQGLS